MANLVQAVPVNSSAAVGKFTVKFNPDMTLTVQWRADLGEVVLRQLPALSANAMLTAADMIAIHDLHDRVEARPYLWGIGT